MQGTTQLLSQATATPSELQVVVDTIESPVISGTEESLVISGTEESLVVVGATEDEQIITDTVLSWPSHSVKDLISIGVCVRCIFRLFGVSGRAYSVPLLSPSVLCSLLKEPNCAHNNTVVDDCLKPSEDSNGTHSSRESDIKPEFCSICLGILQFAYKEETEMGVKKDCANDFAVFITELVKKEGHQIDSFALEVSVPPIILVNERSVRLYMKRKYGNELWFQEKFLTEHMSVKEALKLSITNSLQTLLAVNSGVSSFRIRLTYTCTETSLNLHYNLERNQGCKRRKRGTDDSFSFDGSVGPGTGYPAHSNSEEDAVIHNDLPDHVFCERFTSPPEKVNQPCHLALLCNRMPIYIAGRYLKYSRNVSQSQWIIDDERKGETSVEEILGSNILPVCRGDNYKFHAAGREDIDVRTLGPGRPFLVEVQNARHIPSEASTKGIEEKINNLERKLVRVRNLKVVGSQGWTLMREGEAEKQKQYAALVWISRPLKDEDVEIISSLQDMQILQKTPVRVLHRRSPLEREKIIDWMKVEKIAGSSQYFLLHLCTQAGTYIKEFVHGDLGRTYPSVGSILGCRAEILQLDVTDVKMDCF